MDETTKLPEEESAPVTVCDVRFRNGSKTYYFDPNGLNPKPEDHLIIETARGPEYGYCSAGPHTVPARAVVAPLRKVLRLANERDEYVNNDNRRLEKSAYQTCQEKIEQLGLDMQLVSCEVAFDGSKLLFYFTADGRVDFRELVKQLASTFHTRVELRQIGVRDKAKMVGGLGICGRPFCCRQFLSDFAPVSIKMAKTQNLSLNPTKISGTCGRLMCCLKYEQEAYEDLLKSSPKAESFVDTPDGRGVVIDVNLMAQTVKVRMEQDPEELKVFRNEEIAVFRNGKAKKNDAPIPEDWAPISGGKPAPTVQEEYPRFERSAQAAKPEQDPADQLKSRRSRREKPQEAAAAAPVPVQPEPAQEKPRKKQNRRCGKGGQKANPTAAQPQEAKQQETVQETKKNGKHVAVHHGRHAAKQPAKPQEQPAPTPKAAAPQPTEAPENAKKRKNRRYYHRPKKNG